MGHILWMFNKSFRSTWGPSMNSLKNLPVIEWNFWAKFRYRYIEPVRSHDVECSVMCASGEKIFNAWSFLLFCQLGQSSMPQMICGKSDSDFGDLDLNVKLLQVSANNPIIKLSKSSKVINSQCQTVLSSKIYSRIRYWISNDQTIFIALFLRRSVKTKMG